ncbi:MAG: flagellar biosynthesis protein FlhB [Planctomycetota bacterium]
MPEQSAAEKTEEATPRKRSEARRDGNLARSTDLTAAVMLLAGVLLLALFGQRVLEGMARPVRVMLSGGFAENRTVIDSLSGLGWALAHLMAWSVGPLMLSVAAVALLGSLGQVGLLLTGKPLVPKFSKLNPITGAKRLFDLRALVRLFMSLGKLIAVAGGASLLIAWKIEQIAAMGGLAAKSGFLAMLEMVFILALKLAVLLLILGVIDYVYQKFQHSRDLRMTKDDVKKEMKDMDGDPQVKQRRARVARQLAMQRVQHTVPSADVVVTNPTHFAVALQYDSDKMGAPRVVAKGADLMAMRVRQVAAAHGIPVIERKPLARALYHGVQVGQEVPPEHYAAVAEILAYVYRLADGAAAA